MAEQKFEDWLEQTRANMAEEWKRLGSEAYHKMMDEHFREDAKKFHFTIVKSVEEYHQMQARGEI